MGRRRYVTTCTRPGCDTATRGGPCPDHQRRTEDLRPSAAQRGYGPRWRRDTRDPFIAANPRCAIPDCDDPATVPDHHPYTRRQLVELGVPDPDDWRYLRPLCQRHHNQQSGRGR